MKKLIIVAFLLMLFLFSCNGNTNKIDEENPQEAQITFDENLAKEMLDTFHTVYSTEEEYEIKKVFGIYGKLVVAEICIKNKEYIDTSFNLYSFDEISFVVPGYGADYYLLCYADYKFYTLNEAYKDGLLLKEDLLDLKKKTDEYYYNNDLWYERIIFKCTIKKNDKREQIDFYINGGKRETASTKSNLIDYDFNKDDYNKIIESFKLTYGEEYSMIISCYYGEIDGVKLFYMQPNKYAGINSYYYVGKYKFPTAHKFSRLYVMVDNKVYLLEDAYNNGVVSDYIVRYAAFYTYLQKINGRVFGNSGEYVGYTIFIQ